MEVFQIISCIVSITTGSFAILVAVCKPIRNWLFKNKKEKEKAEEEKRRSEETDRCLLRDRITSIYFKNRLDSQIKEYEYENVSHLYKQYKALGGNSFVDRIWREMQDWQILP